MMCVEDDGVCGCVQYFAGSTTAEVVHELETSLKIIEHRIRQCKQK